MSKFIERLQSVFQPPAHSMGFNTARSEQARPRIQLVVKLAGVKLKSQIKELDQADALVLPISVFGAGKTMSGVWFSKGDAEEVEKATKAGADFIILPESGEVLPHDKKIGRIIQIEASITDILLRTVNTLPVDAVLLNEEESGLGLTWKRLMLIQRFSSLLNKPLLVEVLPSITDTELQAIWEGGVSGIIVTANAEQADAVAKTCVKSSISYHFRQDVNRKKVWQLFPASRLRQKSPKRMMAMTMMTSIGFCKGRF